MKLSNSVSLGFAPVSEPNLVAKQENIDINSLGDVKIPFIEGCFPHNTAPLYAKISRYDGILNDVSLEICLNGKTIKKVSHHAINGIGSSQREVIVTFPDDIEYPKVGDYSLKITQINGCFAAVSVSIHALKV